MWTCVGLSGFQLVKPIAVIIPNSYMAANLKSQRADDRASIFREKEQTNFVKVFFIYMCIEKVSDQLIVYKEIYR